jgi:HTH-type transcriptional regulator/antitoxin MqsA
MYKDGDQCPICGHNTLKKVIVTETFEYKGKKLDYPNYIIYKCQDCQEAVVDKASMKESGRAIRDFYRQVDGLLISSEIKRIRKFKLCLTQDQASELLGGGAKSFARYENNEVIQSAALDNLLRVLDKAPYLLNVIKKEHGAPRVPIVVSINSTYETNQYKMVANYGK